MNAVICFILSFLIFVLFTYIEQQHAVGVLLTLLVAFYLFRKGSILSSSILIFANITAIYFATKPLLVLTFLVLNILIISKKLDGATADTRTSTENNPDNNSGFVDKDENITQQSEQEEQEAPTTPSENISLSTDLCEPIVTEDNNILPVRIQEINQEAQVQWTPPAKPTSSQISNTSNSGKKRDDLIRRAQEEVRKEQAERILWRFGPPSST